MYKVLLLDADETLLDYEKAEMLALKETLENFGYFENGKSGHSFSEIHNKYSIINKKLWSDLEKGNITKDILRAKRFSELFESLSLEYNPEKFSEKYIERLMKGTFLLKGAEELCKYLNKKYKLVIVTNGIKEVQHSRIRNSLISGYIDEIAVSDDIGIEKPNPEIFKYALNLINHSEKRDVLMLGDSLTADIKGGLDFGIDTCWVNLKNMIPDENIKPKYIITDYKELYEIL